VSAGDDRPPALLVTADGAVFSGEAAGAAVPAAGARPDGELRWVGPLAKGTLSTGKA